MYQLTVNDFRSDEALKEAGFGPAEIDHFKNLRFAYFEAAAEYQTACETKDYSTQLDLEADCARREAELRAFGARPNEVPLQDFMTLAHSVNERDPTESDPTVVTYRQRIKNPATAMRAFCITCQGGSLTAVNECAAVNCPLYYFRTGKNNIFGRPLPPPRKVVVNDAEVEQDEIEFIDEGQDGGDAS